MVRGDVTVRRAEPRDVADLTGLFAEHRGTDEADEKVDRYRERLASLIEHPGHHILVAEHDGAVIGYAAAQDYGPAPDRAWSVARMHDLWVSPDARGLGAGTALFSAVRDWAERDTGIQVLEWQSLDVATEFYGRLGLTGERDDNRERFELAVHLPSRD